LACALQWPPLLTAELQLLTPQKQPIANLRLLTGSMRA